MKNLPTVHGSPMMVSNNTQSTNILGVVMLCLLHERGSTELILLHGF